MPATQKVTCPLHHVELIVGSIGYFTGIGARSHLICPATGCDALSGKICDRCGDLIVRTYRDPARDQATAMPGIVFAAHICPACDYNNFEVEEKSDTRGPEFPYRGKKGSVNINMSNE